MKPFSIRALWLSFWAPVKAVLWAFLGIRRNADHRDDAAQLKPVSVVVAAVLCTAIFVVGLLLIVRAVS